MFVESGMRAPERFVGCLSYTSTSRNLNRLVI
jgi:hypothetical protein